MNESVLSNGVLVTGGSGSDVVSDGAVVWSGDRIVDAGGRADLLARYPGARALDAQGGVIMPGLVNLHHHFYSALARGLDPGAPTRDFPEILDRLWWRLDRALDTEAIRVSALLAAADCARWGCTTVFDHHASPTAIDGSLDLIASAVDQAGISAVLCYEVTDRNGPAGALAGIEENLRFLEAREGHPRIRGLFGLHASFTLRDETLAAVGERRPTGIGCHTHVGEHPVDGESSRERWGAGPVERLHRFGLLDDRALLAHGIHLAGGDYRQIADAGATIIHNPESNANNGVGRLRIGHVSGLGCRVGLGTDGMSGSMTRALRFAYLNLRGSTEDPTRGFGTLPGLLDENAKVARDVFGEPLLGHLEPGAPADIIVVDSPPPTVMESGNAFSHLVYGLAEAPVRHTIARGRVVLEDFRHTTMELSELVREAREVSGPLWERFHALDWDTPYIGE